MGEAQKVSLLLMVALGLFLAWGVDQQWRVEVIRCESLWLITILDQRAYALGIAVDETLRGLLKDTMAQYPGSFGEGLVMGLRMVMMRIGAEACFAPLLILIGLGFFYEAHRIRAIQATRYTYTSPLSYRRLQKLFKGVLWGTLYILVLPVPVHPLSLTASLIMALGSSAWRYTASMKQT